MVKEKNYYSEEKNLDVGNGSLIYSSTFYLITKHRVGDKMWNIA